MTAQLEQNPRPGRELSAALPMTWRDYLAMTICYGALGAVAWALVSLVYLPPITPPPKGMPYALACAALAGGVAWIVGHCLEGARRADP